MMFSSLLPSSELPLPRLRQAYGLVRRLELEAPVGHWQCAPCSHVDMDWQMPTRATPHVHLDFLAPKALDGTIQVDDTQNDALMTKPTLKLGEGSQEELGSQTLKDGVTSILDS